MKHRSLITGRTYEVGELIEYRGTTDTPVTTYDMIVIIDFETDTNSAPKSVNYYFGDYDFADTEYFISKHMLDRIDDVYYLTDAISFNDRQALDRLIAYADRVKSNELIDLSDRARLLLLANKFNRKLETAVKNND